jgi:hypothetical protein
VQIKYHGEGGEGCGGRRKGEGKGGGEGGINRKMISPSCCVEFLPFLVVDCCVCVVFVFLFRTT